MDNPLHSSETSNWYTPPSVAAWIHEILGGIALDPASDAIANLSVQAGSFFTKEQNGLAQDWIGETLFMNPPYSRKDGGPCELWVDKLLQEFEIDHFRRGVALVNATPDRRWFHKLWPFPICFLYKRVRFLDSEGKPSAAPTHGNALVLLPSSPTASEVSRFASVLRNHGEVIPTRSSRMSYWDLLSRRRE